MVLESVISAKFMENKPLYMLLLSVVVSAVSVFISYFIFPEYAGVVIPLVMTVAMAPLVYKIFTIEEDLERKEAEHKIKLGFLGRHGETMFLFALFFMGAFITFFVISVLLPEPFVSQVFAQQIDAIGAISDISGMFFGESILDIILLNNLKVMFFSFLLSFMIGAGAIYILSWNASILAVYLASFLNKGLPLKFYERSLGIIPHAPFEIVAYFLAGMAGGILSVGLLREHIKSKEFMLVFRDSLILLGLAVLAVFIGAFLEVFI